MLVNSFCKDAFYYEMNEIKLFYIPSFFYKIVSYKIVNQIIQELFLVYASTECDKIILTCI